jgi:hypothetical protein
VLGVGSDVPLEQSGLALRRLVHFEKGRWYFPAAEMVSTLLGRAGLFGVLKTWEILNE